MCSHKLYGIICKFYAVTGRHYCFYIMGSHHKFYGVIHKF